MSTTSMPNCGGWGHARWGWGWDPASAWPALSLHILCTATTAAGQAGAGVSAGGACLSEDGGGPLVVDARHVGVHDGPLPCRQLAARDGAHLLGARVGVGVGVGVWARVGVGIRGRGSIGVRVGVRVGVGVWARARVKGRVKTRASRDGLLLDLGADREPEHARQPRMLGSPPLPAPLLAATAITAATAVAAATDGGVTPAFAATAATAAAGVASVAASASASASTSASASASAASAASAAPISGLWYQGRPDAVKRGSEGVQRTVEGLDARRDVCGHRVPRRYARRVLHVPYAEAQEEHVRQPGQPAEAEGWTIGLRAGGLSLGLRLSPAVGATVAATRGTARRRLPPT